MRAGKGIFGAVLELPRGRFQDRSGAVRVPEEQITRARQSAWLGLREQVASRILLADLRELPIGGSQRLLAALPVAEHGMRLGGVQHCQPGDDSARHGGHICGVFTR
jgi:hypothetical protein